MTGPGFGPSWRLPSGRPGQEILILPDVRGLHPYYEELALRFAEVGVDALAIDYFGRTAGVAARTPEFDHAPHIAAVGFGSLVDDIGTGASRLRQSGRVGGLFTVGFCFGGRLAFLTPTLGLEVAGAIGFYGWPVGSGRGEVPAPADSAAALGAPILGIFGGADQGIGPEAVATFETALSQAAVEHELITYPGAPHSFFDRKAEEYAEASADAWQRVLGFIETHTPRS